MPRPADTYTHSQFEEIDTVHQGQTVRCIHCKKWQGNARVLNRKKAHLEACLEYKQWRAAGNGQELAPPNPYNAAGRRAISEAYSFEPSSNSDMQRPQSKLDLSKNFHELLGDDSIHKRVRCQSCGLVQTENAAQQKQHLMQCEDFASKLRDSDLRTSRGPKSNGHQNRNAAIWSGEKPNPHLQVNRQSMTLPQGTAPTEVGPQTVRSQPSQVADVPSLTQHLLRRAGNLLSQATENAFLSQAGSGLLTENALNQWLAQIGYISRSLIPFTGAHISKIRIPETAELKGESTYRCADLLSSTVANMMKELEFLEATKLEYGLETTAEEPRPSTRSLADLLNSASCSSATLLEGMVMLWAVEALLHISFSYAGTLVTYAMGLPQANSYALPSYFLPSISLNDSHADQGKQNIGYKEAIRDAFIENWKSEGFGHFVDACRLVVDDLALSQPTASAEKDQLAYERVFRQAVWLWGEIFADAIGAGEDTKNGGAQGEENTGDDGGGRGGCGVKSVAENYAEIGEDIEFDAV